MATMTEDIADLVGSRRERATLEDLISTKRMGNAGGTILVDDMMAGVTVSWLAQVFSMDPKTVKAKLADCPPLHRRKAGYVYHLPVACAYLIKPATSTAQFMKNLKASDLPNGLQQQFWDALLKRQKWEENAGQLWRTDKVREVLGSTFQTIKFTMQLWSDTLERQTGLTGEQRDLLTEMVDSLQEDIYKALVTQSKDTETGPQSSELEELLGEAPEKVAPSDDWMDNLV